MQPPRLITINVIPSEESEARPLIQSQTDEFDQPSSSIVTYSTGPSVVATNGPKFSRLVVGLIALVMCVFGFLHPFLCQLSSHERIDNYFTIGQSNAVINSWPVRDAALAATPPLNEILPDIPAPKPAPPLSDNERLHYKRLQKMEGEFKQHTLVSAISLPQVAPVNKKHLQRDAETVIELQNLLPHATTKGDSTGERLTIHSSSTSSQRFSYDICSFTNVCAARDGIYLQVQSESEYNSLAEVLSVCFDLNGSNAKERPRAPSDSIWSICQCFLPISDYQPRLLPFWRKEPNKPLKSIDPKLPSQRNQTSVNPLREMNKGHFLGVHKYVNIRHIAHWAQKLLLLQSIMQHSHAFPSDASTSLQITSYDPRDLTQPTTKSPYRPTTPWRPVSGMVIHNLDLPMTSHEENILQFSLQAMTAHDSHPGLEAYLQGKHLKSVARYHADSNIVFGKELDRKLNGARSFWTNETARLHTLQASATSPSDTPPPLLSPPIPPSILCYERLSFVSDFGLIATNSEDTQLFRHLAYRRYGLMKQLESRCPPRRIILLYRHNRHILNSNELIELVESMTKKSVERVTINGTSTSEEQIRLFASAGLVISPHSSQLINVLFSHPSSSLIEVTPEYHNSDFSEYAHGMGVHFTYALGGQIENGISTPGMKACTELLMECEGDSYCILERRHSPGCQGVKSLINKKKNFYANLTAVKQAVQHSLDHLRWSCHSSW